ncbi:MAG: bactofilin family protein [Hyphomicrobiaceae bacterium]
MFGRNSTDTHQPNGNGLSNSGQNPSHPGEHIHTDFSNTNRTHGLNKPAQSNTMATGSSGASSKSSVISNDLTIIGQSITIVSQGHVQIDGAVQGNVHGKQVSIGPQGAITGTVMAENVEVRGQLQGSIRSPSVTLHPTAQVEGDIHHRLLSIAEGAEFDGRVRRPKDPVELQPILDPALLSADAGVSTQNGSASNGTTQHGSSSSQSTSSLPTPPTGHSPLSSAAAGLKS